MMEHRRRNTQGTPGQAKDDIKVEKLYRNPVTAFIGTFASIVFWLALWSAKIFILLAALLLILGCLSPDHIGYLFNHLLDPRPHHTPPLASISNFLVTFFERSSVHGLLYLVKRGFSLIEKCLWLLLLIVSMVVCLAIALESLERYYHKSTVIGLERDFYYWNTTMPGVTVCPLKRLDVPLFDAYCRDHRIEGPRKAEFFGFLESLANSTYINFYRIPSYDSIDGTLQTLGIRAEHYMALIFNLTKDNSLKASDKMPQINEKIRAMTGKGFLHTRQVLTEYGLCYMTNSYLDQKYSSSYLIHGTYPETVLDTNKPSLVKQGSYFNDDMVFHFLGFQETPIDAYFHSAYEIMQVDHNTGYRTESTHNELRTMEIIAEDDLEKSTSISQRNCRFQHESNLTHFPIYTKNLCLQECRLNLVYKQCNCIPHFYPNRSYFLKLYRASNNSQQPVEMENCYCLQNCLDAIVNNEQSFKMEHSQDIMGGNNLIVSMSATSTMRLKRQIIFSFTDLLVSIGGTAGLFLGFSVLGAVEIIYYFTLRLLWHVRGYKI